MTRIEEFIDIDCPVTTVYNQFTQFEDFPQFMEGVESVTQLDDTRLHWVATVGGTRREWDAKIVDQTADSHIAWESPEHHPSGAVTFEPLDAGRTKRTVRGDLMRFKDFIEHRGTETGAWRGDISGGEARRAG
jgi:uncharacterized membrane protein